MSPRVGEVSISCASESDGSLGKFDIDVSGDLCYPDDDCCEGAQEKSQEPTEPVFAHFLLNQLGDENRGDCGKGALIDEK